MKLDLPRAGVRELPLAAKVIAALALTLLPLGILAAAVAVRNYQAVVAARATVAAARSEPLRHVGMSAAQALGIALPMLMWLAAALIGWIVAASLIVRPLTRLRGAVERYTAGDKAVRLGGQSFFSREVTALAAAFDAMADDIATHDAEMHAALFEQQRLTREVHHRVKNNLQIVSSLLSIQSRDAASADVAQAYALVQSRVAALALVHRWMYESDAPGGGHRVDLRALATDLCAGLEQSLAASEHLPVRLRCDVERLYVGQDTAVPLAFLITELVSCAARLAAPGGLAATIAAHEGDGALTMLIASPAFVGDDRLATVHTDPASRIIHGMARQLRSPLRHDAEAGAYAITVALPPQGAAAGTAA